ncbi:MAG: VTT domain-containing protein [Pseudomonadota bacterium]
MSTAAADDAPAKRQSIWVRLWPIYIILGGLALAVSQGWHEQISPQSMLDNAVWLDQLVRDNLLMVIVAYVLIYAAATAFMIPGSFLTIFGGFLFPVAFGFLPVIGTLATVLGATLGASLLFAATKTSLGSVLRDIAGPFLEKMRSEFNQSPFSYMFALRLIPIFPFAVVNIAPGLLGAKYRDYLITTFFGVIPGTMAYTWIGSAIKSTVLEAAEAGESLDVAALVGSLGQNFLPAFAALGVVALIPVAYKKLFGGKTAAVEEAG